jgi:hypothetical protein
MGDFGYWNILWSLIGPWELFLNSSMRTGLPRLVAAQHEYIMRDSCTEQLRAYSTYIGIYLKPSTVITIFASTALKAPETYVAELPSSPSALHRSFPSRSLDILR